MIIKAEVTIHLEDGEYGTEWWTIKVTKSFAKEYMKTAVDCWGGSYGPEHPFFPTNIKKVTIGPATIIEEE